MPFTPAHAAAALPFRRTRLNMSALIIGTCAPDFEYFLRLAPNGRFGHSLLGVFVFTLPLALVMLWLFNRTVRTAAFALLPDSIQRRIAASPNQVHSAWSTPFVMAIASAFVGILTHLLWDSFTHPGTWPYHHWSLLSQTVRLPIAGTIQYYKVFQHSSTVFGMCILAAWFAYWYRTSTPSNEIVPPLRSGQKLSIIMIFLTIAVLGSGLRVLHGVRFPISLTNAAKFIGEAVVTFIALIWWQLVVYGLIFSERLNRIHASKTETT